MTVLEENGGGVAELEVRVETLEGTAADHETRISAVEAGINGTKSISCKKYLSINSGTHEVLSAESVLAQKFKSRTSDSKAKDESTTQKRTYPKVRKIHLRHYTYKNMAITEKAFATSAIVNSFSFCLF